MTDRELLELAAKAAGHKIVEWTKDGNGVEVAIIVRGDGDGFSKRPWQPLHENQMTDSDGDALRLFYTLPWMCIETSDVGVTVRERGNPDEPSRVYLMWTEWLDKHNGDLAPATRLAITRAAAEIGKAMP